MKAESLEHVATSAARPKPPRPARHGRVRVVIENVRPEVDHGRFPVKRTVGDEMMVEADAFADGHDVIVCRLRYRHDDDREWRETDMEALGNDRWRGRFTVEKPGRYRYTVTAWTDAFRTWRANFSRRTDETDIVLAARVGSVLVAKAANRASTGDAALLRRAGQILARANDPAELQLAALAHETSDLLSRYPDRRQAATYDKELAITADRERARYSTWYEMFPRSAGEPGSHGTFADCEKRLPYISEMGFDVLYLPPIHPIGSTERKGRNNTLTAAPGDVGSPWAIGATGAKNNGGHKAIHPELGTLEDFRRLVAKAHVHGIELALDIAFQCSPDHPYVAEHPEWFRARPDGSIQYAENPPKKYQDIYPFDFESSAWASLWEELKSVFDFWLDQGIRIFRVDNPHTKPFAFWEWAIADVKARYPDAIFLAEAFTRPRVMHRLAKLGFSQSYTYFAWRNTREELVEYFTELARSDSREYFRPNVWPNTPDILTATLQHGGRPAFSARLLLAATLSASYGIYGPAYELLEHEAREPGSEEYLNSEKYEIKHWDIERADSLRNLVARVNTARRNNPALQADWSLAFFPTDNNQLIAYCKTTPDLSNIVVTVVNLDTHFVQSGWLDLDIEMLGIEVHAAYEMHDAISGERFAWHGRRNFIKLEPGMGHVLVLKRPRGVTP